MSIKEICSRSVVTVGRGDSIVLAAQRMREHHVGSVVVAELRDGKPFPVGMLTDRDVAIGVVATGLDPARTPVEAAMRAEVVSVHDSESVACTVSLMRAQGVRRLPVVDGEGVLVGIVSADDLLELFSGELSGIAALVGQGDVRGRFLRAASS